MKIAVEKVGTRIYLRSPWSPTMPERCKSLGGRWNANAKAWTYPLDLEMCRRLRNEFKDELEIGRELWAWSKSEVERERKLHDAGGIKDMNVMAMIELPRIMETNPTMWEAMLNRPYQPVASLYVAVAGQSLVADQPGVGKTIEVLGGLIEAEKHGPILVVAPLKSTQAVWEPEINRWMADYKHGYSVVRVSGLGKGKKLDEALALHETYVEDNPAGLHFLIANAEMARIKVVGKCPDDICNGAEDWCPAWEKHTAKSEMSHPWLFQTTGPRGGKHRREWAALIADETHNWLINTRGKNASQVGHGFAKLRTMEDNFRVAMTGTPLKGKKQNLFGTLNWLRPDIYTSKWRWIETYFEVKDGEYGGKQVGRMLAANEESFFRSLKAIMIRRTKKELRAANPGWMPPDKQYHDIWVEMDPKQAKLYNKMESRSEVELESGVLSANGQLAEMTRLKQFANMCGDYDGETFVPMLPSCKLDWLMEFIEERGIEKRVGAQRYGDLSDTVQKVVVASQFTSQLEVISKELTRVGIRHTMITGKTKDALHEMKLFQGNDSYRLCLINIKAGGVSITLDAADDIVLLDETWVPDEMEQVEDRVHRASNVVHQVDVWYVRTKGTIEEDIAMTVETKAESNHVVLDAKRGLAYARRFGKK